MPVSRFENGLAAIQKLCNQFIQRRDDFVSVGHGQRPSRAEIILYVNDYQRLSLLGHTSFFLRVNALN
jgi:hypothetical protein